MHLTHRDQLGAYLNEAGLLGAGAEVGSEAGAFAATVLATWRGRALALVDPWAAQDRAVYADSTNDPARLAGAFTAVVRLARADDRVRLCRGYSPAAAAGFEDGSLDFVYVDGNHAYLAVAADLAAWYPKLKPGGLFAGHDYLDGVVAGSLFGVRTAVDEFALGLGLAPAATTADPPLATWHFHKPVGPPPAPDRVTVLTGCPPSFGPAGALGRANKAAYCARHGYRFVCRTDGFDPAAPPAWAKVRFLLEELPRADLVFWSDPDALVMNGSVPVTRFVRGGADLVLTAGPGPGVNDGHWLVRGTPWAERLLARLAAGAGAPGGPAAALARLYAAEGDVRRHVALVPNALFNGFPYPGGGYARGDFVAHLAGLPDPARAAALHNYAAMAR